MPTDASLEKEVAKIRQNEMSPSRVMMTRLDELTTDFPARCAVLYEYPSGQQVRDERFIRAIAKSVTVSNQMVDEGNFDQALPLYCCALMAMAALQAKREPRMVELITRLASMPDISQVVAFVGTDHSLMQRAFRPLGFRVTRIFLDRDIGVPIYFAPEAALWRRVIHEPRREVSELEWHAAMLGDALYRHAEERMKEGGRPSRQRTLAHIHRYLRGFTAMSDIEAEEERVRNKGIEAMSDEILEPLVGGFR